MMQGQPGGMTNALLPVVESTPPPAGDAAGNVSPATSYSSPTVVQQKLGNLPPGPVTILYGSSQCGKDTLFANLFRNPEFGYREFFSHCYVITEKFHTDACWKGAEKDDFITGNSAIHRSGARGCAVHLPPRVAEVEEGRSGGNGIAIRLRGGRLSRIVI